jgi:GGDEF domain-containing protein
MNEQKLLEIKEYLQQPDVQQRIRKNIADARSHIAVSISRAASLFGFSESQLREWEKKGLLTTDRTAISQDSKGHRQYTTYELDKLAAFKELFNEGGFAPGDIPQNFDTFWSEFERELGQYTPDVPVTLPELSSSSLSISSMPIDQRVEHAEKEVFWRYFVSQALRLSLSLICEDIQDTIAGLILPLNKMAPFIEDPKEVYKAGESLIGWLAENRSFATFLDNLPSFVAPSDFRIEALPGSDTERGTEEERLKNIMIVVPRNARPKPLPLSDALVQTVKRFLRSVYDNIDRWKLAFNAGARDYLYQATNFDARPDTLDDTLESLTDMVIELGRQSTTFPDQNRWRFCCLLLPQDASLPLQQRSLVVRAQSLHSPYKVGDRVVSVDNPGLSLRAYQSGSIIYRPVIPAKGAMIAYQEREPSIRSAVALPLAREDGLSIGVLYVASEESDAFPIEDQRVLRLIGIMVEELLLTYRARQQVLEKRSSLIDRPGIIDPAFESFLNENSFIEDLETMLESIHRKDESDFSEQDEVSFIAIDIDNQSTLATKLGNRVARNLSRAVGLHIQDRLSTLFTNPAHQKLYHLNADCYCLILDGISLKEARHSAERLRTALAGSYRVNVHHNASEKPTLPENLMEVQAVTVHLGIPAYKRRKLRELLKRFDDQTAIYEVRSLVTAAIDRVLKEGRRYGGDVIVSWDYDTWDYGLWKPHKIGEAS